MGCNCSLDQTPEDTFTFLSEKKLNAFDEVKPPLGIGIFFIPAPELGVLEKRTVFVENINYAESIKRGHNCFAFQWAPYGVTVHDKGKIVTINSAEDIVTLDCSSRRCSSSGCTFGCYCNSGDTGNCKPNLDYNIYDARKEKSPALSKS